MNISVSSPKTVSSNDAPSAVADKTRLLAHESSIGDQLLRTLQAQRAAFLRDGPPSLAQRQVDLEALKQAILSHRDRLVEAVNEDFGHRSHQETSYMYLMRQHQYPETAAKYITTFIRTTK